MATTKSNHILFDLSGVYGRAAPETTVESDQAMQQPAAKKPVNRCSHTDCRVKLMLTDMSCKCELRFCSKHRQPETHQCTFDFKAAGRALLEKNLVKVSSSCLERI